MEFKIDAKQPIITLTHDKNGVEFKYKVKVNINTRIARVGMNSYKLKADTSGHISLRLPTIDGGFWWNDITRLIADPDGEFQYVAVPRDGAYIIDSWVATNSEPLYQSIRHGTINSPGHVTGFRPYNINMPYIGKLQMRLFYPDNYQEVIDSIIETGYYKDVRWEFRYDNGRDKTQEDILDEVSG